MTAHIRESKATIRWLTHPPDGVPRLSVGSHSFHPLPLSINTLAPNPLAASPGELIAGAFGSVFAWLLAGELVHDRHQALELTIEVELTAEITGELEGRDPALCGISCQAQARVPGEDEHRLQALCEEALARTVRAVGLREDIATSVDSVVIR